MSSSYDLVDAHHLGLGQTGNETWARNVLRALERRAERARYRYALTAPGAREVAGTVDHDRVRLVSTSSARRLVVDLPRLLRAERPAAMLVHYTLPRTRVPGVVVVHDVSFEEPEAVGWIPRRELVRYRATIRSSVRRARVVLTPSEHARTSVLERYRLDPSRVLLAPNALDEGFAALVAQLPARRVTPHSTVLFVGTVLPRKNLGVVADAVAQLRQRGDDVRLRLVGPVREAGAEMLARARAVLGPGLEVVGAVSTEQLAAEYRSASVLAFPSLYEGFGIPLLEAMAAELPVVCSDTTSLPEVAGPAALLADPRDPGAWVEQLGSVLGSPGLQDELRALGREQLRRFSWDGTAAAVREALDLAAS